MNPEMIIPLPSHRNPQAVHWVSHIKVKANPLDAARASRRLWRGHLARAVVDLAFGFDLPFSNEVKTSTVRDRDAPAIGGEAPARQVVNSWLIDIGCVGM
jgi:hypothetical protein